MSTNRRKPTTDKRHAADKLLGLGESVSVQPSKEKRKNAPFFTEKEVSRLIELVKEREVTCFPNSRTPCADKIRNKAWQEVVDFLNAEFGNKRTVDKVYKKWDNVKSIAKKSVAADKKSRGYTGGGRPVPEPTANESIVAEMYADSPAFNGLENPMKVEFFVQNLKELPVFPMKKEPLGKALPPRLQSQSPLP